MLCIFFEVGWKSAECNVLMQHTISMANEITLNAQINCINILYVDGFYENQYFIVLKINLKKIRFFFDNNFLFYHKCRWILTEQNFQQKKKKRQISSSTVVTLFSYFMLSCEFFFCFRNENKIIVLIGALLLYLHLSFFFTFTWVNCMHM